MIFLAMKPNRLIKADFTIGLFNVSGLISFDMMLGLSFDKRGDLGDVKAVYLHV